MPKPIIPKEYKTDNLYVNRGKLEKTHIFSEYIPTADISVIFQKDIYERCEVLSVVGFYYGQQSYFCEQHYYNDMSAIFERIAEI